MTVSGGRAPFAGGILFGLVAEQLVLFSIPLLIFQETRNVTMVGIAYALEWLPSLLAYPIAGLLADRIGGRTLFRRSNAARAGVLALVVLICVLRPSWTVPTLIAGGAILASMVALARMSVEKMAPQLATGTELAKVQGLTQNMELLALALGPGLAIGAVAALGKVWLLGVATAMFAVAAVCWWTLPLARPAAQAVSVRATLGEIRLGWTLLTGNRPVVLLASLNFSINLVFATALGANAAIVTGVFKAPESSFGLLNMCVGVTGLINLLLTPLLLKRFDVRALGVIGMILICLSLSSLGVAPSFAGYAVAYVLALVGVAYFNVYNRTQRVRVIPRPHLGKVMGPFLMLNILSYPIGGLLIASVGAAIGPQRLITILAVALTVVAAVLVPVTMRSFSRALARQEPELVLADAGPGGRP